MDARRTSFKNPMALESARSTAGLIQSSSEEEFAETAFTSPSSARATDSPSPRDGNALTDKAENSNDNQPLVPDSPKASHRSNSKRKVSTRSTTKVERFTLEEERPRERRVGKITPFEVRELQLKILQKHKDGEPLKSDTPPPVPPLDIGIEGQGNRKPSAVPSVESVIPTERIIQRLKDQNKRVKIKEGDTDETESPRKPYGTDKPKLRNRTSTLSTLREVEVASVRRLKSRVTLNDLHFYVGEEHVGDVEASEIAGKFVDSLNEIFRSSKKPGKQSQLNSRGKERFR